MDVVAALVTDAEAPVLVEPGDGALDDPPLVTEPGSVPGLRPAMFGLIPMSCSVRGAAGVVAAVGEERVGSATGWAAFAANRWDRLDEREQLGDVVPVGAGDQAGERDAAGATIRWCLVPALSRSTGLGPVLSPPSARSEAESIPHERRRARPG